MFVIRCVVLTSLKAEPTHTHTHTHTNTNTNTHTHTHTHTQTQTHTHTHTHTHTLTQTHTHTFRRLITAPNELIAEEPVTRERERQPFWLLTLVDNEGTIRLISQQCKCVSLAQIRTPPRRSRRLLSCARTLKGL